MNDTDDLLQQIRRELTHHFTRHGEYNITSPLLLTEIKYVFERAYTGSTKRSYENRGASKDDAFQEVIVQLLETRSGMKARHLHTIYFEYHDRNDQAGQPYVLAQSRRGLRLIMEQALSRRSLRSIADNVFARSLRLLSQPPYRTHFESPNDRFTMAGIELDPLHPLPLPDDLKSAVRAASQVPKIRQQDHYQRVNKVYHSADLHLLLQIVLQTAPGLSRSQFRQVIEECLTDRPSAVVHVTEDMNNTVESSEDLLSQSAETAFHVRTIALELWQETDRETKVILSLQFAGWTDQKIADTISFGPKTPPVKRSRAWVTTKFTDFGSRVGERIADMEVEDQARVGRLIEAFILEFDTELS